MENKIGYAVITTEEYKELIKDNMKQEKHIRKLKEVKEEEEGIHKKLEEYFFKRLANSESYHLENMQVCNPTDYHYQQLYKCFLEIGIDNAQYIHLSIETLKENFDNGEYKNLEE